MRSSRWFPGLLALLATAPPVGAQVDVLFRSGQTDTAGYALAGFDRPQGTGGAVITRGRTSALLTHANGVVSELLRTGTPLPAPLQGTFNRFRRPVVNAAGGVVFYATLNSGVGAEGLFFRDGSTVTPIVIAVTAGSLGAFDLNDQGLVAFVRDDAIYLWELAAPTPVRLIGSQDGAPGGGVLRTVGRIALNGAGVVAFAATRRGGSDALFATARNVNPSFIAERRFGDGAIAINASGQVAFTSDGRNASDEVLRFDPGSGVVKLVLKGVAIGDRRADSFDPECVAIDDSGRVVFEAQLDGTGSPRKLVVAESGQLRPATEVVGRTAGDFATRITADGQMVYTQDRRLVRFDVTTLLSTNDVTGETVTPLGLGVGCESPFRVGATSVFAGSREALESIAGGVAQPLVQVGEQVIFDNKPATLTAIGSHVVSAGRLAFIGTLGGTTPVLLSAQNGLLEPVVKVASTEPTKSPVGGVFITLSDVLEPAGDDVLFVGAINGGRATGGIFRVSLTNGRVRAVATSARKGRGRLSNLSAPTAVGAEVAFRADQRGRGGIYLTAGKRVRPVLLNERKAPVVGGKINALRAFAGTDSGLHAAASIDEGSVDSVLYRVGGRARPKPFILDGGGAAGGGAYRSVGSVEVAGQGPTLAFLVPLFGAGAGRGVFTAVGDTVTLRLLDGVAVPGGARLSLVDTDVLGFDGDALVLTVRLSGTDAASRALLAVR